MNYLPEVVHIKVEHDTQNTPTFCDTIQIKDEIDDSLKAENDINGSEMSNVSEDTDDNLPLANLNKLLKKKKKKKSCQNDYAENFTPPDKIESAKRFVCPHCSKNFYNSAKLDNHIKDVNNCVGVLTAKKKIFYDKLRGVMKTINDRSTFLNNERYELLLQEIKEAKLLQKNNKRLSAKQRRRLKRYDILKIGDTEKLIRGRSVSKTRYFCKEDELFDILEQAHISIGHKRTRVMETELKKKYCNFTRQIIDLYLSLCEKCELRKRKSKRDLLIVKRSVLSECLNSRCLVNLIDMESEPDKDYRFIMNYKDCLTKFTILRPLKTKAAEEVAYELMDIFCLFGFPCILQSDNGSSFVNKIIRSLTDTWPAMKLLRGKPRPLRSQNALNEGIHDMLGVWMAENDSEKWSEGLQFIQCKKNRSFHSAIKKSPYEAMFGSPQKMGLADLSLSSDTYASIETEEELEMLCSFANNDDQEDDEQLSGAENKQSEIEEITQESEIEIDEVVPEVEYKHEAVTPESEIKTEEIVRESENGNGKTCAICKYETSGAHKCSECHEYKFTIPETNFIKSEVVPSTSSTLELASTLSSGSEQSFISCHCKRYCLHKKCKCRSNNIECNSKCHNNSSCKNK